MEEWADSVIHILEANDAIRGTYGQEQWLVHLKCLALSTLSPRQHEIAFDFKVTED